MINLDETKALEKIAEELGAIDQTLNSMLVISANQEPGEAVLLAGEPGKWKAEPASVPILLIIEVLCALIRLVRAWRNSKADKEILARQLARLEPYLPVRPQGKDD